MTSPRRTRSFAALATASVLALTACGSGEGSGSSSDDSPSTSTSSSPSSAESSAAESSEESESPDETQSAESPEGTVTAKKSGVSFELPQGWETFDPNELLKDTSNAPKGLEDMAKAQGVTVDQLLQNLAQSIDLMAMGESKNGFTDNVNVIPSPQPVSASELKASYEQQGGTVTGTDEVKTSAGAAPSVTYTMSNAGRTIHGQVIGVPTDSGAALITVSASDASTAKEAITTIADSVQKS